MHSFNISKNESAIIKGMALCAMLFHHLFYKHPEYGNITYCVSLYCKICVSMFVLISGYGIASGFERIDINIKNSIKFIFRRLIRFYSNYWFIFIIFVPLGVLLGRTLEDAYGTNQNIFILLFKDILGIQYYKSYNITWWFNKLIIQLYILFPLLFILFKKTKIICLLFAFLLYKYMEGGDYVFVFLTGIFFQQYKDLISQFTRIIDEKVFIIIAICLLIMTSISRQYILGFLPNGIKDIFVLIPFLFIIANSAKYIHPYIISVFTFLGRQSSNGYMIHTFIYYYFFGKYIYISDNPIIIFLILLSITCIISVILEKLKTYLRIRTIEEFILKKIHISL